ncbi:hypothetical protein JMG10_07705 [Nostoc ellipsosporum NOK]|nr:hypothetical protein [Nostoc ellipsosporum NOK]
MKDPYKRTTLQFGAYIIACHKKGIDAFRLVASFASIRSLINECYLVDLLMGMAPLEMLDQAQKRQLWEETKSEAAGKDLPLSEMIRLSKAIYWLIQKLQ